MPPPAGFRVKPGMTVGTSSANANNPHHHTPSFSAKAANPDGLAAQHQPAGQPRCRRPWIPGQARNDGGGAHSANANNPHHHPSFSAKAGNPVGLAIKNPAPHGSRVFFFTSRPQGRSS